MCSHNSQVLSYTLRACVLANRLANLFIRLFTRLISKRFFQVSGNKLKSFFIQISLYNSSTIYIPPNIRNRGMRLSRGPHTSDDLDFVCRASRSPPLTQTLPVLVSQCYLVLTESSVGILIRYAHLSFNICAFLPPSIMFLNSIALSHYRTKYEGHPLFQPMLSASAIRATDYPSLSLIDRDTIKRFLFQFDKSIISY